MAKRQKTDRCPRQVKQSTRTSIEKALTRTLDTGALCCGCLTEEIVGAALLMLMMLGVHGGDEGHAWAKDIARDVIDRLTFAVGAETPQDFRVRMESQSTPPSAPGVH